MSSCSFPQYFNATETLSSGYFEEDVSEKSSLTGHIISDYSDVLMLPDSLRQYQMLSNIPYQTPANFLSSRSLIRRNLEIQKEIHSEFHKQIRVFAKAFSNDYSLLTIVEPVDTASLRADYQSPDWVSVDAFIQQHSFLLAFLQSTAIKIKSEHSTFGQLTLEYFYDSSEQWEKIYLICQTDLDDPNVVCALEDELFNKFFSPLFEDYKGKVVLSLV